MFVFIWTATEKENPKSRCFSEFQSAWGYFGDLTVSQFPHYIQRIEFCNDYVPEVTWYTWSEFIDLHVNQELAA